MHKIAHIRKHKILNPSIQTISQYSYFFLTRPNLRSPSPQYSQQVSHNILVQQISNEASMHLKHETTWASAIHNRFSIWLRQFLSLPFQSPRERENMFSTATGLESYLLKRLGNVHRFVFAVVPQVDLYECSNTQLINVVCWRVVPKLLKNKSTAEDFKMYVKTKTHLSHFTPKLQSRI